MSPKIMIPRNSKKGLAVKIGTAKGTIRLI